MYGVSLPKSGLIVIATPDIHGAVEYWRIQPLSVDSSLLAAAVVFPGLDGRGFDLGGSCWR